MKSSKRFIRITAPVLDNDHLANGSKSQPRKQSVFLLLFIYAYQYIDAEARLRVHHTQSTVYIICIFDISVVKLCIVRIEKICVMFQEAPKKFLAQSIKKRRWISTSYPVFSYCAE